MLAWINVDGDEAESFLQGQLTNNVNDLDGAHSQLHGYCNPKGRLIAVLRIARRGGGFLAQLPAMLAGPVVERLRQHVLRARVEIERVDDLVGLGLAGHEAVARLAGELGALPESNSGFRHHGDLAIWRVPGPVPRLQLLGPEAHIRSLRQSLERDLASAASQGWALLDIYAGIPQIQPETSELFVPQSVNLDLVGGVSFKKGCYTGQEIVARMHYLGKPKQRMIRAEVVTDVGPEPAARIYSPEHGEQSAGTVVQAEPAGPDRFEILAAVQIAAYRSGQMLLNSTAGPALQPKSLPYELNLD